MHTRSAHLVHLSQKKIPRRKNERISDLVKLRQMFLESRSNRIIKQRELRTFASLSGKSVKFQHQLCFLFLYFFAATRDSEGPEKPSFFCRTLHPNQTIQKEKKTHDSSSQLRIYRSDCPAIIFYQHGQLGQDTELDGTDMLTHKKS